MRTLLKLWAPISLLLVVVLFASLVLSGWNYREDCGEHASKGGPKEWRSQFDVSSAGEVVTLVAFFLTFNPICIGLILGFSYQYLEALRTQVYEIERDEQYTKVLADKMKESRKAISDYASWADLVVFDAGLFWLFSMLVGVLMLAHHFRFIVSRCWLVVVMLIAVGLHVTLRIYAWRSFQEILKRRAKESGEEVAGLFAVRNAQVRWTIVSCWSLWLVDVFVPLGVWCRWLRFSGFWIFAMLLSVIYLGLWFVLAAKYMPGSHLQFMREKLVADARKAQDSYDESARC